MAIRVLGRPTFNRFVSSTPTLILPLSKSKPQSFSTDSASPIPITPEFSQQSQHRNLISLSNLFQRYGFPPSELHDFLTRNRFILNSNYFEVEKSLEILLSLNSCQKFLVSVVYGCPRVLELEFAKKWEMSIYKMGVSDITSLVIQNVLEVSGKFNLDPGDLSRCVQRLKGFGLSTATLTRVLEVFPMVIMMSEESIRDKIEFFIGIGICRNEIDRILKQFPGVLAFGVENKLKPLLSDFKGLGFSLDEVRKEILRDPRVLGLELGELSRCLRMLRIIRCRVPTKEKIFRYGAFRAGYEVKLRIDCLHKHGLIYREAFIVLWKEPRAILYDIGDIEKKIEFLVNRMKFGVLWLVEVPEYLGVNFEKQIVPRYNVIEYLRSKGGLGDEVGLQSLIKPSRLRFYNLYVKPYPECEKIYGRVAGDVEVKSQHPVGMWKLFNPPKYPESEEDVKNIRSFMEALV